MSARRLQAGELRIVVGDGGRVGDAVSTETVSRGRGEPVKCLQVPGPATRTTVKTVFGHGPCSLRLRSRVSESRFPGPPSLELFDSLPGPERLIQPAPLHGDRGPVTVVT